MPEDPGITPTLFTTPLYRYIRNRKDLHPGGRGRRSAMTTVVRIPWTIGLDLEDLLLKYEAKISLYPSSPRNAVARKLLNEIYDLMP